MTPTILRVSLCLLALALLCLPVGLPSQASEATSDSSQETRHSDESIECTEWEREGETVVCTEFEEEEEGPACHGIVTCTFYGVGQVIAFPFHLMGAVFRFVF